MEWVLETGIFVLLFFTLIATGCAAYFARNQWLTAEDQKNRSLRAYLIVTGAKFGRDGAGQLKFGRVDAEEVGTNCLIYYATL